MLKVLPNWRFSEFMLMLTGTGSGLVFDFLIKRVISAPSAESATKPGWEFRRGFCRGAGRIL